MIHSARVASHVLRGFVHSLRVSLHRKGVPYPWLRESPMVRFKTDRAWPQPSPISSRMPAAVLHIPPDELKEFLATIVARFQRQVALSWVDAIGYLKRTPHLDCPDDATFVRTMTRSIYAYFITDSLDESDLRLLRQSGISMESVRKSDLAPVSTVDAFPGLYCTGSVCYFRQANDGAFEIIGIAMVDRELRLGELICPTDGNSWKRAKMHVLQAATYLSLFVTHPKCHFPMDAIIAVTRTCLPPEHRLFKVLDPHMYLQMPLDYSVLHTDCSFEPSELTALDDRLRQYMWHELYVRLWPLKRLVDIDYGFDEPELQEATRGFVKALAAYARSSAPNEYVPLGEIATSIQH